MTFPIGHEVEVTWDDDGFRGAWYEAKVSRTMAKARRYSVIYDHLVDENPGSGGGEETRPLREMANFARVRPRPPRLGGPFAVHQPVDAWHNDGWWTGVVVAAPDGGETSDECAKYRVCFPTPREQTEFALADLRAHLEWVDNMWIPADVNNPGAEALAFPLGERVEVVREVGVSKVVWFLATVEKHIWENNLLVQYESKRFGAKEELLREVIHANHARPCPPQVPDSKQFSILEEVEVFHSDGWCTAVIARINGDSNYNLKSEHWDGEMEFHGSKLRPWLQWKDGCWAQPSQPSARQRKSKRILQRSEGSGGACKSFSSTRVSIPSDSSTCSDTEMENGSCTFECHDAISLSPENAKKISAVRDDDLLLASLCKTKDSQSVFKAGEGLAISAVRGRRKSLSTGMLASTQLFSKKQTDGIASESLNFGGEKNFISDDNSAHQTGLFDHMPSVKHEIEDADRQLRWVQKNVRRSRTNVMATKRRAYDYSKKPRRDCAEGGLCGLTLEANVLTNEPSLEVESFGAPQDGEQMAEKGQEQPEGSDHLLELRPIGPLDSVPAELPAHELMSVTLTNRTSSSEILSGTHFPESASTKGKEALHTYLGSGEALQFANEESEMRSEAFHCSSPPKLVLPFTQSSPMWEVIAEMEIPHAPPQHPHFRPLLKYNSELREGMAIGLMVTFNQLVRKITKLQINDTENIFTESYDMLNHLAEHGFDVHSIQDRLGKLQRIKYELGQHEREISTLHELIFKRRDEGRRLGVEIDIIDTSVREMEKALATLRGRRSVLAIQVEANEHAISKLEDDEKAVAQASVSAREKFDGAIAAAW